MLVLFVDHETRLSGGERDLVDLVRALREGWGDQIELHAAVAGEGELSRALRAHGVEIHVFGMNEALRHTSRWELQRSPALVARRAFSAWAAAMRLARLASRLRPDVIHTNSLKAHVLAIPAHRAARCPLVWHVRDILEEGWLSRAMRFAGGLVASRIVCISEATAAPFRQSRAGKHVTVVYNGVRPAVPAQESIRQVRKSLGASDKDVIIGIVGQVAHWKGQDVFVAAAERLAHQFPQAIFTVIGDCLYPENEANFAAEAKARLEAIDHGARTLWYGPADPVEPAMAALDVFIHASRRPEPFGRVIVEAQSLGAAVVASTCGAGPELVPSGTGLLIEPGDPDSLANALRQLIIDKSFRSELARAGRQNAARFDISATAAGVIRTWEEVGIRIAP